jgi:cytochrome c oxidase subunit 2
LPQIRIKPDAIPGVIQPGWLTPTETGEWEIVCSQLCGLAHSRMRGFYTIQTQAHFEAWLAEQRFTQ